MKHERGSGQHGAAPKEAQHAALATALPVKNAARAEAGAAAATELAEPGWDFRARRNAVRAMQSDGGVAAAGAGGSAAASDDATAVVASGVAGRLSASEEGERRPSMEERRSGDAAAEQGSRMPRQDKAAREGRAAQSSAHSSRAPAPGAGPVESRAGAGAVAARDGGGGSAQARAARDVDRATQAAMAQASAARDAAKQQQQLQLLQQHEIQQLQQQQLHQQQALQQSQQQQQHALLAKVQAVLATRHDTGDLTTGNSWQLGMGGAQPALATAAVWPFSGVLPGALGLNAALGLGALHLSALQQYQASLAQVEQLRQQVETERQRGGAQAAGRVLSQLGLHYMGQ
jgi:hypothetical protein